ncbi:MAG: hypothetical protein Q8J80_03550 [Gallionella sp.]|nr:hypothetical protein [Gallionella sp.]
MSAPAPIVVFAYRRPEHLRNTLATLIRCDGFADSPVVVYCDGARNPAEYDAVMATRRIAQEMLGEAAEYHFSEVNQGLSRSVIDGVTEMLTRYDRVIVIEDDLELSPGFLKYMNEALARYADVQNVFQVSGYMFDVPELAGNREALFFPVTVSWGWGTWRRAWDSFDPEAKGWEGLRSDAALRQRFNLQGAFDYATMLFRQMEGMRDSWAIRWYWTVFKASGLVVFPPVSLVHNKGFDGSGSHGRGWLRRFSGECHRYHDGDIVLPETAQFSQEQYRFMLAALRCQNGGPMARIADAVRRIFRS